MSGINRGVPLPLVFVILAVAASGMGLYAYYSLSKPDQGANNTTEASYELEPAKLGMSFLSEEPRVLRNSFTHLENNWDIRYLPILVEVLRAVHPQVEERLIKLMHDKTGVVGQFGYREWQNYLWNQPYQAFDSYADFKKEFYKTVDRRGADPRFEEYFDSSREATIRLDEVVHGGVARDGIPPLKDPELCEANSLEAEYLDDDNVVFGVVNNGEARCYPKRILAWHEMVKDVIGGTSYCGVYCTLCGSLIFYETELDGKHHELGTSGFLYRSNKLMYDHETKSLWSTLRGQPVIGPLVGKGIVLKRHHVVTTTWGKWKALHPETKVLTTRTGHQRDYSEGAAYRKYFANDALMFFVPKRDERLLNKEPMLALRFGKGKAEKQMAITIKFLKKNPVYTDELAGVKFVVLTDPTGAARVYEQGDVAFKEWDGKSTVTDADGKTWSVSPDRLELDDRELNRLPAHNAFWFGWFAVYPDTRVVQ